MNSAVSRLLHDVVQWVAAQPSIRGVALVGSHARGEARDDSDVDLVILATEPKRWVEDGGWVARFGEVAACEVEDWVAVTSLRVRYRGGLEVEYGLTATAWADVPVDPGTKRVVSDGMRVLYDPDGALEALQESVSSTEGI